MSYLSLARKYRPTRFSELVGQESIAQALGNAIKIGREPHGIIFSGVRGVGKTTTARLYAKSLNCEQGPTADPCNECSSCIAIAKGFHEDVMEIDGASNTGVADVRTLQETVDYVPQRSKYKVYIIDEVHMLSQAAFNALLKTLEEPPAHVIFVFATTELHKIPQTIVSRCQTFYLQKIALTAIRGRLEEILQQESVEFEEKALTLLAKEGRGSMRDALTALDQAIALGGGRVSSESLLNMAGQLDLAPYFALLGHLLDQDMQSSLNKLSELDQSGAEFKDVIEQLVELTRHCFIVKNLGVNSLDIHLLGLDQNELEELVALADRCEHLDLNRLFRVLAQCSSDLVGGKIDRYIVENTMIEWVLDPGIPDVQDLLKGQPFPTSSSGKTTAAPAEKKSLQAGLADIKSQVKAQKKSSTPPVEKKPKAKSQDAHAHGQVQGQTQSTVKPNTGGKPAFPSAWRELLDQWKQQKPLQARKLEEVHPLVYQPNRIEVVVDEKSYASQTLLQPEEQKNIAEQFRLLFGFSGQFVVKKKSSLGASKVEESQPAAVSPEPAADPEPQPGPEPAAVAEQPAQQNLPDTVLQIKDKEEEERVERIRTEAINSPVAKEMLAVFGGSIKDIKVKDRSTITGNP